MTIVDKYALTYALMCVFCILLETLISTKLTHDMGSQREVRRFRHLVISAIAFNAIELVWALTNYGVFPRSAPLLAGFSIASMTSIALCGYFWFLYAESKMNPSVSDNPTIRMLAALPVACTFLLGVTSLQTGWTFTFSPEEGFVHGPFYPLHVFFEAILTVICSIHALLLASKETNADVRRSLFTLAAFPVVPLLGGLTTIAVPLIPVMEPSMCAAILFIFVSLQDSQIFNDALTGLNNRRRANSYIDQMIAQSSMTDPIFLFLIDANSFKQINDTWGHVEGDRALRTIADALKASCEIPHAFAARWGGDEFVIIAKSEQIYSPESLSKSIREELARYCAEQNFDYELTVSIGYARCASPDMSRTNLINEADGMLYDIKDARARKRRDSLR